MLGSVYDGRTRQLAKAALVGGESLSSGWSAVWG
jgi:hypothetical protein